MFPDSSLHEVHQTELELPAFLQDTRKFRKQNSITNRHIENVMDACGTLTYE